MSIPIIGGDNNIPIIGQPQEPEQQYQSDPRTALIMELMAVVSHCSDVLKAIQSDTKAAIERLDMPDHSLVVRLLTKIENIAEDALTSDPIVGTLLRIEGAMVSKFIRWLEKTSADGLTQAENEIVQKAIKLAIEKTQMPGEAPAEPRETKVDPNAPTPLVTLT